MIRRFFDTLVALAIIVVVVLAIMNREKFSSMVEKKSAVKPVTKVVENAKGELAEEVVVEEQLSDNE
jgi:hypothetical protein